MNRVLALAAAASAILLVGCGEPCGTQAAKLKNTYTAGSPATCTLSPGTQSTINVALCQNCTDSSPSCDVTFLAGGQLEISPVVQQCAASSTCEGSGCNLATPTATCTVTIPAGAQSIPFLITGESGSTSAPGVIEVQGGAGTVCNL